MILLLLVGGLVHLVGYNHSLPFIDDSDESTFLTKAFTWRGLYNQPEVVPGYPPGTILVEVAAQLGIEAVTGRPAIENPSTIVGVLRLASVAISIATALLIGLMARRLGGGAAGWLGASLWLVITDSSANSPLATHAAWTTLFCTLTLCWMLVALSGSRHSAFLSTLAGMLAFTFHYAAFPFVGAGIAVSLWHIWQDRNERVKWLRILAAQIALTVLGLGLLFLVYRIDRLFGLFETSRALSTGATSRLLDLGYSGTFVRNVLSNYANIPWWLVLAIIVTGPAVYFIRHRIKDFAARTRLLGWIVLFAYAIGTALLISTFAYTNAPHGHYYYPPSMVFTVLLAASVGLLAGYFSRQWLRLGIPVAFAVAVVPAPFLNTLQGVQYQALPNTLTALALWSGNALDSGAIIWNGNGALFSREWGGYTGPYRVWLHVDPLSKALAEWRDQYVNYAAFTDDEIDKLKQTQQGSEFLSGSLLLKQFPPPGERGQWRGPGLSVYRLWGIQHGTDLIFGAPLQQVRLLGYDLDAENLVPGSTPGITLYWKADRRPTDNYNVFLHLTRTNERTVLAQADGPPSKKTPLTLLWTDSSETYISDKFQIQIPSDLTPGQYRLLIGLYNFQSGQRLSTANGEATEVPITVGP